MRQIQKLFIVTLCFAQSIFSYYHTCDGYSQVPVYTPFSDHPIHFNINTQQEKVTSQSTPLPLINSDCYQSNYNELMGLPSLFQDQPQSNIHYSFQVTPSQQQSGIPFALMSIRQLAYYFACLGYSREQILEHYLLYTSDAFINLVKQFPEYETALKKHCEKFSKYSCGKACIEWFKGDYSIRLAKHFKKLCDQLPKKEVPPESVPVKPKSSPKKADLSLAREWIQSLHLYKQYAPESAQRFKNRIEAFVDRSLVNDQSAIQRILIQEADDLITIIETDTNPLIREHVGSLRQCVMAAREFIELKEIKTAAVILDFCWSFTELAKSLARDAIKVVANVANNVLEHPVELAIVVAAPVLPPPILCAYHAYRAYQLICYLAPKIKDVTGIAMTALQDPVQGLDDAKTYIRPLTNLVDRIKNKEIALTQCIKSGAIVLARCYVEKKLHGGLSGLFGSIKDKAIALVAKNPSVKSAHYLKTPEGLILKAVQGAQDGSLKERVTQTLHRTEDFFKNTEFGKANEKYFQRTIYGYHGKRAFQAKKNFDHIKKKQYIVLDGLHKNHLEVYGSDKEWLRVINFDGTLNEHLTAKALSGDQRDPLSILGR